MKPREEREKNPNAQRHAKQKGAPRNPSLAPERRFTQAVSPSPFCTLLLNPPFAPPTHPQRSQKKTGACRPHSFQQLGRRRKRIAERLQRQNCPSRSPAPHIVSPERLLGTQETSYTRKPPSQNLCQKRDVASGFLVCHHHVCLRAKKSSLCVFCGPKTRRHRRAVTSWGVLCGKKCERGTVNAPSTWKLRLLVETDDFWGAHSCPRWKPPIIQNRGASSSELTFHGAQNPLAFLYGHQESWFSLWFPKTHPYISLSSLLTEW